VGLARVGRADLDVVTQPQFGDQIHYGRIIGEPVVVEAVELLSAHGEGGSQAPRFAVGLEYRHAQPAAGKLIRRRQAGEAAPHDGDVDGVGSGCGVLDRKSTRLNSSHVKISYAVFCLKKKS